MRRPRFAGAFFLDGDYMKLKNNSARPHWLGDVLIAPGAVAVVDDAFRGAFNTKDLEEVSEPQEQPKRGRPAKVTADDDAA